MAQTRLRNKFLEKKTEELKKLYDKQKFFVSVSYANQNGIIFLNFIIGY